MDPSDLIIYQMLHKINRMGPSKRNVHLKTLLKCLIAKTIFPIRAGTFAQFSEHGIGRYNRDGLTETLALHDFNNEEQLFQAVTKHLQAFTSPTAPGCVLLLYSVLLSRGLEK